MPARSDRAALVLPMALVVAIGVLSAEIAAAEGTRRVALVRPDEKLLRSIVIALSAWDIDVVSVEAPSPGASLPEAARNAAFIAKQAQANAVAWVSDSQPGSVLWIYDADSNQIGSRVLDDSPPFDEPMAAAAALSVKALLLSSSIAPASERLGAISLPAAESRLPPPAPVARPNLWIEAEAAVRASPKAVAEPRGALGLALWPRALNERVGCAVDVSGGVGAPIATVTPIEAKARFYDWIASSSVRTRARFGQGFALEPALGASAHFTSLEGTARPEAAPFVAHRVDGSLDAAVSFALEVGRVGIAARASMEYLLRYPRYLVDGKQVLSLTPFVFNFGLRLSAGTF